MFEWVRSGEQTNKTSYGVNIITQSDVMKNLTDDAWLWISARVVHRATRFIPLRTRGIHRNRSVAVTRETQVAKFVSVSQPVGRVPLMGIGCRLDGE
jgi:hypothetical protein